MIAHHRIKLIDFRLEDIPTWLDYWYRSPPGFIESRGVDPTKLPSELEMRSKTEQMISKAAVDPNHKLPQLSILVDGQTIGTHPISNVIEGETGVLHAHIWNPQFRRMGVGTYSYPKACEIFMERFSLKEIIFRTPIHNIGPNRVKEKLGIPCVGEGFVDHPIVRPGTKAKIYKLDRANLRQILARLKDNEIRS